MGLFSRHICEECHTRFKEYKELVRHVQDIHKRKVLKCSTCGEFFLHEKDRLHHVKKEKESKIDERRHRF